jgi:tetratricopeptide (TPR) repeat protein
MRRGQLQEALALFRLNIEAYPWSSNVYDSYAEALMANRQYDLAVRNFRRSLELDPGNRNATKNLKELQLLTEHTQPRGDRP